MESFKEQQLSQQAFIANVFGMQKEQQLTQNDLFKNMLDSQKEFF
jgi:hypothetical protein